MGLTVAKLCERRTALVVIDSISKGSGEKFESMVERENRKGRKEGAEGAERNLRVWLKERTAKGAERNLRVWLKERTAKGAKKAQRARREI